MSVRALHALPLAEPHNDPLDFRWYLAELSLAPRTITQYMAFMLRADAWCEERGYPLATVPGPVIAVFANTLPKSQPTRRTLRTTLRHYWAMHDRHRAPLWAIKVPRQPRMICKALQPAEASALAAAASVHGGREGLAVLVGLYQGFRREEIASMAWSDFAEEGWIRVLGKGDLPAELPLHPVVAGAVERFRAEGQPSPYLFPARLDKLDHVHGSTVWGWVKKVAAEAGIEHMTTHWLRHTALAQALDTTKDLRAVRDFARHASVDTTQGYTRTTAERLRAVSAAIQYGPEVEPAPAAAVLAGQPPPSGLGGWLGRHGGRAILRATP